MSYLLFVMVLILAGVMVVLARAVGVRAKFEPTFQALAILLSMLPVLVMSAIVVFGLEVVAVAAASLILQPQHRLMPSRSHNVIGRGKGGPKKHRLH